ncbi:MAG: LLM class F420-dependent oxidoreductase [Gammaproteobacteria bacterium]|nr:LLM class F420-dependent oxidoreductase [Gammaproteobacteria bacterium]
MEFSFRPPNADYLGFPATKEGIVRTTQRAEELGFDTAFLNDHIIVKGPSEMVASWSNTFDPLVTLGYLAASTSRIRLGTSVLIMPYRNPVASAKMIATLDQLSDGRITVGIGAGWLQAEFDALGITYEDRGARTDEYLRVWKACWSPDPISFSGNYHSFEDMYCSPKPVQQPHPPIWIGGSSRPALRRAAQFAAVWQPVPTPLPKLIEAQKYLYEACAKIGRSTPPSIRMSFRTNFTALTGKSAKGEDGKRLIGHGDADEIAADMQGIVDSSDVDSFQINFNGCRSLVELEQSMDMFAKAVRPQLNL